MLTLNLKVVHRILLSSMLNESGKEGGFSLSELNKIFKILDKIDFTAEERKKLNIRMEDGMLKWFSRAEGKEDGEEIDVEQEFEISDDQKDLILAIFKKHDEKKAFTLANLGPTTELADQVGYSLS